MVKLIRKIKCFLLLLIFLAAFPLTLSAQSSSEQKQLFAKAESYYLYEDYELANQLYLLFDTTGNSNIQYKIGNCYLNIPGEKEKSISYLQNAVKNSSYDSKTLTFKEKKAPLDAYFSLAKAYLINNEPDKALKTLQTFNKLARETTSKGGMQNLDYVEQQMQACKNTIQFKEHPVSFSKKSMGSDFSQGSINDNPAVSFDGNTIVYTERRGKVNAIFCSKKERGTWQPPIEITSALNAGDDCSSSSLNRDGTQLFLYKTDNYDGVIYSSDYVNGAWTPISKLNKNINTKFYESHAAISYDGKKLYFTSNRDGGQGNLDIYVSEKDATGDWGPALNLGSSVNTPFNEDTPFITQNDSVLYFCSEGHNSLGGFDNFKSERDGSGWKKPVNLGFPINTTDDDKFFEPANNGRNAFYSMTTGYKKKEIFYLSMDAKDVDQFKTETPAIPATAAIDTGVVTKNLKVSDADDLSVRDSDVFYYSVQVMALHKPVDISYFKNIAGIRVMYSDTDKFFHYITGKFSTKDDAVLLRNELLRKGYPEEIFIKKVSK